MRSGNIVDMEAATRAISSAVATAEEMCGQLGIAGRVGAPHAAGLSSLVSDERDLGVTLIDMGGGTTSIAVFYEGHLVPVDTIPVGGEHVTRDIARGLSTPLAHAERMKTQIGRAVVKPNDEYDIIDVPLIGEEDRTRPNHIPRSILVGIIPPRIDETFQLGRNRLEASGVDKLAGGRAVIVGGACQLDGVPEVAAAILNKKVRIGGPLRLAGGGRIPRGPAPPALPRPPPPSQPPP